LTHKSAPLPGFEKTDTIVTCHHIKSTNHIKLTQKENLFVGPRRDEHMLYQNMAVKERQELTRALCGKDMRTQLGYSADLRITNSNTF
jgi:hypothetical protein